MSNRHMIFSWFFVFSFCIGIQLSGVEQVKFCAPVAVGGAMICLEYVAYAHPVVAIVGSSIGLAEVAYRAYKTYTQLVREKRENETVDDDQAEEKLPAEVFLAERYYYEQRKKELATLRDEFAATYKGIVTVKELFHPQAATFSSQFLHTPLKHHAPHPFLTISLADELKLLDERKNTLRTMREQELTLLEKEITELHALLVVHFNMLMLSVFEAREAYDESLPAISQAINVWNLHKDGKLTDHIASQTYEQNIIEECLVRDIQQKIAELKVVVTFYQKNRLSTCLQQSTDILNLLDGLTAMIADTEQETAKKLIRITNNMFVNEHYFAQRGIPTTGFKNQIKGAFNKDRSQKNAQVLKNAKDIQADMCASGGPNDPKKDHDDKKAKDPRSQGKMLRHNSDPGQKGHHFRKGGGHIEEFTPEAERLLNKAFEEGICYGVNKYGRWTYSWTNPADGNQIWIEVMNDGTVSNCGANVVHWTWNAVRGALEKPAGFVQPARGIIYK